MYLTHNPDRTNDLLQNTSLRMLTNAHNSQEQALLLRRRIEGYKYEEIAEEFDIPVGTVKSALFNAKKRQKRLLEQ